MAKLIPDAIIDLMLTQAQGTTLLVCAGQPTDRATALTNALADVTIDSGDYTKANGDTSGRKNTIGQQSAITIDSSGDADHIAVIDGTSLLLVTTCTTQTLTAGGTVTVPAFAHEIRDAA